MIESNLYAIYGNSLFLPGCEQGCEQKSQHGGSRLLLVFNSHYL